MCLNGTEEEKGGNSGRRQHTEVKEGSRGRGPECHPKAAAAPRGPLTGFSPRRSRKERGLRRWRRRGEGWGWARGLLRNRLLLSSLGRRGRQRDPTASAQITCLSRLPSALHFRGLRATRARAADVTHARRGRSLLSLAPPPGGGGGWADAGESAHAQSYHVGAQVVSWGQLWLVLDAWDALVPKY
jgi:hypothetical protein